MLGKLASEPAEIVLLVLELSVVFIVAVLALSVKLVLVAVVQTVPVPLSVQVPLPIVIVRVLELLELNNPVVKFLPLASKVPLLSWKVLVEPVVKASCKVNVPPGASMVMFLSHVRPAFVSVKLPRPSKVYACVEAVKVIPETMVSEPKIEAAVLVVHVGVLVTPVQLMFFPALGIS